MTSEQHSPAGRGQPHVAVTGGSGFIGRWVVEALRARDTRVTVIDPRPLPGPWDRDPGVRWVGSDLTDPGVLEDALGRPTSAVVHLAAVTSVLGSVQQPAETFRVNVTGTQAVLEAMRLAGVPKLVFASTNAVTGDVGEQTISIDLPPRPLTPYGATKAAGEMLAFGYAGSYGLTAAVLRLTNVYGPGMAAKDSFVPRLMRAALSGDPVRIYGDGCQSRDLVHVDDVCRAVLLALDSGFSGRAIVGSGRSVSVLDMVEQARVATGRPLPTVHIDPPAGEMPAVRVDLSASRELLGYQPSVSLADGLAGVWRDFLEHRGDELSEAPGADAAGGPAFDGIGQQSRTAVRAAGG